MLANEVSDEVDERIKTKYKLICETMGMEDTVADSTWNTYCSIRKDQNLEGDQIHWLCSALYIVHNQTSEALSNISLTKLLRMCNITLYEFIKKTEQWINMVQTTKECEERFGRFVRSFCVSIILYEKYRMAFNEVFIAPDYFEESMAAASVSTPQKGKKTKQNVCTPKKVYEFCWYLFISAKSENPDNTVDLVTSFHMLLCCLDLIFANMVADKRDDLLNKKFEPAITALAPKSDKEKKSSADSDPVCIIRNLCEQQQTTEVDVLAIKLHVWKDLIKGYFNNNILKGNPNNFMGLLTGQNYDHNLDSLKRHHEMHVRSVGKIDEGIFLFQPQTELTPNDTMHSQIIKKMMPETPLTRKNCLPGRDAVLASPVTMATQNVSRLHQHLNGTVTQPSAALCDLFRGCETDPFPDIRQHLKTMSKKFCAEVKTNAPNERFDLAVKLYYRLLENIIRNEKEKQRQNFDMRILNHTKIHTTLIACSVEIVIYSFGTAHNFPWVLKCLEIDAFYFYKIIEIIVQNHENILNRDLIKHLNTIEEQCLESLAWQQSSPLWGAIGDCLAKKRTLPKQAELRSDSFSLFFRKFYKLAFIRLEKLSNDLDLAANQNLQKIWTTFEYSICHHIDLMKDRHLDQLLMCSIYIFCKFCKLTTQFKDIMTVYRAQPQAKSHIYREVHSADGEKCDIITFYNNIYVKAMQEFILHLKEDTSLSPLPCKMRFQQSPRKVSKNHCLYVSELQTNETLNSNELISFTFNASPIQDLKKINKIVSEGLNSNGKRTLPFAGFDQQSKDPKLQHAERVPYTTKNLITLMSDRENSDK